MARNLNIKQMKGQTEHQPMQMAFHGWIVRVHVLSYPALSVCNLSFWLPKHTLPWCLLFFPLLVVELSVFPVRSVCFECGFFHLSKRAFEVDLWLFSLTTVEGRDLKLKWTPSAVVSAGLCRSECEPRASGKCEPYTLQQQCRNPGLDGLQSSWGFCLPGQKTDFTKTSGK